MPDDIIGAPDHLVFDKLGIACQVLETYRIVDAWRKVMSDEAIGGENHPTAIIQMGNTKETSVIRRILRRRGMSVYTPRLWCQAP